MVYVYKDCKCGQLAGYRVGKRFGVSQPTWSQKPLYCYNCAKAAAEKRTRIEQDERSRRLMSGNAKDCDILQGLAEDLREWVARRLEEAGKPDHARHVSDTPIIMNSQYRQILGRAHFGENRRIEWSLAAYQNAVNINQGHFRQTLLHEWAHILDHFENGRSGHGYRWGLWCEFLTIPAKRHTDVRRISRRIKKYELTEAVDSAIADARRDALVEGPPPPF